jgi:hypothetical protein
MPEGSSGVPETALRPPALPDLPWMRDSRRPVIMVAIHLDIVKDMSLRKAHTKT